MMRKMSATLTIFVPSRRDRDGKRFFTARVDTKEMLCWFGRLDFLQTPPEALLTVFQGPETTWTIPLSLTHGGEAFTVLAPAADLPEGFPRVMRRRIFGDVLPDPPDPPRRGRNPRGKSA